MLRNYHHELLLCMWISEDVWCVCVCLNAWAWAWAEEKHASLYCTHIETLWHLTLVFFVFFLLFGCFFVYYYYLLFIILPSHYTSTPLLPKFNYFRLHVNWNWNWFKFCQHFVRSTFIYVFEVFSQFSLFVFCIFCFFFFYFCVVCCCFLAKNAHSSSCCIQLVLPEFGYTFEMLAMNATNARRPEWIRIIS